VRREGGDQVGGLVVEPPARVQHGGAPAVLGGPVEHALNVAYGGGLLIGAGSGVGDRGSHAAITVRPS
jgi:hypothetical protein